MDVVLSYKKTDATDCDISTKIRTLFNTLSIKLRKLYRIITHDSIFLIKKRMYIITSEKTPHVVLN